MNPTGQKKKKVTMNHQIQPFFFKSLLSFLCLHMTNNTVDWTETSVVWPSMRCLSSNSRLRLLSLSTVKLNHFLTWLSPFKVYFHSHSLPVALLTFPVTSWNHFYSQQSLKVSWLNSRDIACYILSIHESTHIGYIKGLQTDRTSGVVH